MILRSSLISGSSAKWARIQAGATAARRSPLAIDQHAFAGGGGNTCGSLMAPTVASLFGGTEGRAAKLRE